MNQANRFTTALVCVALLWSSEALALAPGYVSDEQLAKYPIIVVANWVRGPVTDHVKYRNDDPEESIIHREQYVRLNVIGVVKGKLEPGEHDLIVNWGIAWNDDGTSVNTGTSTYLAGDVEDVTKPCLWFLKQSKSWDETRKNEYLTVGNYREVQPLELKDFYIALGRSDAAKEVPKLLKNSQPIIAFRVLHYLAGGVWPWPHEGWWPGMSEPKKPGDLLHQEAGRVWEYLQAESNEWRPRAASVYAELAGDKGIPNLRSLLDDKDPDVRGIAIGILGRHRDEACLDQFAKAAEGIRSGKIVCQVIKVFAQWKEERTVPTLITFLQNDTFAYRNGDDIGIPALKAQQALQAITSHDFPFDVAVAQNAWQEARLVDDKVERKRLLEELAPGDRMPFVAAAVGLPAKVLTEKMKEQMISLGEDERVITVRVRNLSSRPVTLLAEPSEVERSWPAGNSCYSPAAEASKQKFTTLEPRDGFTLDLVVDEQFLIAEPTKRRLCLSYLAGGNEQGLKAWIGVIDVEFGPDWKYERELKQVEETWPNGNLKATGTTVNGLRWGEWNLFNEAGDRIEILYYGSGQGSAICNPEHATNRGAGKRPAKSMK